MVISEIGLARVENRMTDKEWLTKEFAVICQELGIPFVDINAELAKYEIDGKWLFIDRSHLTDFGNEMAAGILRELVIG